MLFSELAKRVAEKYPEVKTAYPMDCELSNVELYDPNGAVPPVDSLSIYTARQISQDMTLPLCFVCAGTPDQEYGNLSRFGSGPVTALNAPTRSPGAQDDSGIGLHVAYTNAGLEADVGTRPLGFGQTDVTGGV